MKQYRAPIVLALLAALLCILLTLAAWQLALQHLRETITDPLQLAAAQHHLLYQFRALALLAALAAGTLVWWAASRMAGAFETLGGELIGGTIIRGASDEELMSRNEAANRLRRAVVRFETELQRQMQMLRREAAERSQLVNAVSEGLVQLDESSRVLQANPAAIKLLGLPDNIGGKILVSIVRNVELREIISAAAQGNTIDAAEVSLDDQRLLISAAPIPATGSHARRTSVLAIADLTQLRRLEGVRRDFVANVSHELKTPLTSIHGYAETLRSDPTLSTEMRNQFLDVINRNAVRLQNIVDDLLDLSRIESGAWLPRTQRVDAVSVLRDAWVSCREDAMAQRITFSSPETPVPVQADPDALRQVFANLFHNAVRYTPANGCIDVRVSGVQAADGSERYVRIDVKDTGSGIPREALPRIFERFYRVDPARSRAAGGTGLGLAIVKHLVESMGGEVSAASELGIGTTITLTLPAHE